MEYAPSISQIAMLLADPKRSAMLWALIDGATRGADELASLAGLSTPSASAHLSRLSAAGLVKHEARGRKRFFRLATPEVGVAVEALASVSAARVTACGTQAAPLPQAPSTLAMRRARQCGNHLGGEIAADLYARLSQAGWIEQRDRKVRITPVGTLGLAKVGIYVQALAEKECGSLTTCSDWCSHRPHIGGALGASLMKLFMQSGWVQKQDDSRVLRVSRAGAQEIAGLGLAPPEAKQPALDCPVLI